MYICVECQEKFKSKPEYCTCGNDEFKFVADEILVTASPKVDTEEVKTGISYRNNISGKKVLSLGIFILCLILSVLVWFINPKSETKKTHSKPVEVSENIPNIDAIWNDAPAKNNTPVAKKEEPLPPKPVVNKVQEQIKNIITPQKTKKNNIQNPTQTTKTEPKKVDNQNKTSSKQQTQKSEPVKKETKSEAKPQQIKLPQSIVDTVKAPVPNQKQDKVETFIAKPIVQPKPEPPKMSETEFLNYKGAIRSALLAKLNVVAIKGAGDCAIEFSLDNSGKLINRNFIYKSANKTVNDEVYNMLMRLPYYKEPPAHYNGEKIKLKFTFNNGYYEITFI